MLGTRNRFVGAIAAPATVCLLATVVSAQPANDDCNTATPITGNGVFNFDLTNATDSGLGNTCMFPGTPPGITNDVWYCWTATCTGLVTVDTCGQTQVDTRIAIYPQGCGCPQPDTPACCGDDECPPVPGLQTRVFCDVICGQKYLIQLGTKPGTPPGAGTFRITCEGEPCPPMTEPCEPVSGQCCAARPNFNDPAYAGFGPFVSVITASPSALGTNVVAVHSIVNPNGGPFNTDFGAPIYSNAAWNENDLGCVFGVTLDDQGNIYVAASSAYSFDSFGTLGGIGDVYKINTTTAAVTVLATLPNNGPALGNIAYDCAHDQLFVSNMDDGKIYRLSMSGATLSTFDFGAPDNPTNNFAPLGDRVWAVQPHNGRLYFSVWWEDAGNPSATQANEVWSVALDGTGNFVGAAQFEVAMPPNTGTNYSNPVSDIRFTPSGSMLVAERGMANETDPVPHQSRLLEFDCAVDPTGVNGWVLSPNTPYGVGVGSGENTAGGVDIDYSTGGRVYATGDALQLGPQILYGIQGLPWAPGSTVVNSILIDYNANLNIFDKTFIGDVAVPCKPPCMEVVVKEILCEKDAKGLTGCYDVTLNITNLSGVLAQWLLIPSNSVTPNVIVLNNGQGLPNNQTVSVTVTVCGDPDTTVCFPLVLANAQLQECCATEVCIDLPDCDCFQLHDFEVSCITPNSFRLNFAMQNLSSTTVEHLFFLPPLPPDPLSNMVINPSYMDIPTLPPFATTGPLNIQVTLPVAPAPGTEICIYVALHDQAFDQCCYKWMCFDVPNCPQPACFGDTNGDHVVNIDDILVVVATWGPCPPPNPPCAGDVSPTDGDRMVNIDDLLTVINAWGPCP